MHLELLFLGFWNEVSNVITFSQMRNDYAILCKYGVFKALYLMIKQVLTFLKCRQQVTKDETCIWRADVILRRWFITPKFLPYLNNISRRNLRKALFWLFRNISTSPLFMYIINLLRHQITMIRSLEHFSWIKVRFAKFAQHCISVVF